MGDLGKLIAAKGFTKSNKLPNLVTLAIRLVSSLTRLYLTKKENMCVVVCSDAV